MADLAKAVQGAVGQPSSVRVGTVESVSPLVITAQGVPFEDVGFLGPPSLRIGDPVVLLGQSSEAGSDPASWVALGLATNTIKPLARLIQTSAQSLPNNASTPIEFDSATFDTVGGWDPATPSRYNILLDGVYRVGGGVSFFPNGTGIRTVQYRISGGADEPGTGTSLPGSAALSLRMAARGSLLSLTAGQYIEIAAFQNSGAPLNTAVVAVEQSSFDISYEGRA